ncbi:protein SFI1 homolog isoform X2 [Gouania willdenowi]|uniref:protein SFI1 homolog isoform X2 n=1 Tax=Gouania willdenowi TaxID=441366 RepID=UPI001056D8C3|nr:protein SFI1 homolog isoform X2 [Gouania willdenowi]
MSRISNMQRNTRVPGPVLPRSNKSTSGVRKQVNKRIPYRVGYTWNKGGRLKELRIRNLARKFLNIWIHNTFGRIPPHKARSYYKSVVLRRAFEGWRDEWWTSRREWSLSMRAECHYRYSLCSQALNRWQKFVWLQRKKKAKVKTAQSFADRKRLVLVWDRWQVFTQMQRIKNRMGESALKQSQFSTMHSAWRVWQRKLLHHQDLQVSEDRALRQRERILLSQAFLKWKETHTAVHLQKQQESKATLHFSVKVKKKTIHQWASYVSIRQRKKRTQAIAQRNYSLLLVRMGWSEWRKSLVCKKMRETRLQAAGHLARHSMQRRALLHWRIYVVLCKEEAERNQMACQHHHHHLLRAGLRGLSLNVLWNKTQRLNAHMADKVRQQTLMEKHWTVWQERLEEAEDQSFEPLVERAVKNYSFLLLRSCFHHWRERLAEKTYMQELEHRADVWFVQRTLRRPFRSWFEFTLLQRKCELWKAKTQMFNRQRQLSWVFSTWWGQLEKRKEEMLSERMAILHEMRGHLQRAWNHWRQRTQQRIREAEKQEASRHLFLHKLLHKTMTQWKENSTELRNRRIREKQACHHRDLRLMRAAAEKWKEFVERRRVKKRRLEEIQRYREVKLLKQSIDAWKIHVHADDLYRQQTQRFLRKVLLMWRENAARLAEIHTAERRAQNHFEHSVQLKMFLAWRTATSHQVSKRRQQQEALLTTQKKYFDEWKMKLQHRRRERKQTELALWHWSLTLQAKVLFGWRFWATEQRRRHKDAANAAQIYRDQLLREGVTRILTYAARMNDLTSGLTQDNQEQRSRQLQKVVKHCATKWKHRALGNHREESRLKKTVTFCLPAGNCFSSSESAEQESADELLSKLLLNRRPRRCPRRCEDLFASSLGMSLDQGDQIHNVMASSEEAFKPKDSPSQEDHPASSTHQRSLTVSLTGPHISMDSTQEIQNHEILLPPSAFMTTGVMSKVRKPLYCLRCAFNLILQYVVDQLWTLNSSGPEDSPFQPFHEDHSSSQETQQKAFTGETEEPPVNGFTASSSILLDELLNLQVDMKHYQLSRKQLRDWRKLKEVLESWLETSGKYEEEEKHAVVVELQELEHHINKLSTELERQKPKILRHTERIQHVESALEASGVKSLWQQVSEMEVNVCVYNMSGNSAGRPPASHLDSSSDTP